MTILVPVDGTDRGLEALRTAVELGNRMDAELVPFTSPAVGPRRTGTFSRS